MNDLVLNVKQIAQYQQATPGPLDAILFQQGGIGGSYAWSSPQSIVAPAIAQAITTATLNLTGVGPITWSQGQFLQATSSSFSFNWPGTPGLLFSIFPAGDATLTGMLSVGRDPANPFEVSTKNYVDATVTAAKQFMTDNTVWTVNGKSGNVNLTWIDLIGMGGAPIMSPAFQGTPTAPAIKDYSAYDFQIATTQFVQDVVNSRLQLLLCCQPFVFTFNGRSGNVVLTDADLVGLSIVIPESPAFTGTPTTPTPPVGDNSTIVANTEFVQTAIADLANTYAPINSPNFTGMPTAPTATAGTQSGQIATTAFVMNAVAASTAGVASFNTRTGAVVLDAADVTSAGGALLVSPVFTGTPQAPTAAPGNSSVQLATTAFVMNAIAAVTAGVSSFNTRTGAVVLTAADITGAGGAPLNSPGFTGVPTGPTAAPGSSTTELATTAFVTAAISTAIGGLPPGVTAFNGRTGSVTLGVNDISAAGGAVLASPAFTGTPTGPTAAVGLSNTQLATTAFVAAAVAAMAPGVASFNGRSGAVTLTTADVTGAGGAPVASPGFTGTPTAPTAAANTSTTQIATTAFVTAAIASGGVTSFNGRNGVVTLVANDVSAVGGAMLVSPAFTGLPTAPTAAPGVSTTQLATCAFVAAAMAAAGGVTSFNGRAGVVTLTTADINAAGGPYLPTAGGTLTGSLRVSYASSPYIRIDSTAAGQPMILQGSRNNLLRWQVALGDGTAETGGNAGSNFAIQNLADNGAFIETPLAINRATGGVTLATTLSVGGYGLYYTAFGANGIGFQWSNSTLNMMIDGGNQGNLIASVSLSGLTSIQVVGLNGSTSVIQANYGAGAGSVTWPVTFSDRRLKRNIATPTDDALKILAALPVHQFDLTNPFPDAKPQHWQFGLIADEVEAALPTAFIPASDDKTYQSIRELPLIALLVKAVQQLSERLDRLDAAPRAAASHRR